MAHRFRGRTFDQLEPGEVLTTPSRTVTEADLVAFAGLSGDYNPLHTDEEFARASLHGGRIAHGALGLAITTGLAHASGAFEGTTMALVSMTVKYRGVIRPGDTIRLEMTVLHKRETSEPDRGFVTFGTNTFNQRDERVIGGEWVVLMKRGA